MLKLVLGRSGSGKTHFVTEIAQQAIKAHENAVIIVPEQFTFETERMLLKTLGPEYCLHIEVLSFSRLVHRVFSQYGGFAVKYIDDGGRYIIMSLALKQISDMLLVYKRQTHKPAFAKTMVDTITEYKLCGIEPEMIEQAAAKLDDALLRQKLTDITLIMRTYDAILSLGFADALDDLTRLAHKLELNPFFKDKTVIIDAFKGFTPQERLVLNRILLQADNTYITLCTDKLDDDEQGLGLFSPVKATARQVISMAQKNGIPVAKPITLDKVFRFSAESLLTLEERIFTPKSEKYDKPAPELHVISAADIYDEAQFAAQEISRLVREEGVRYSEIVIISRGMELYSGILDPVFEKYGIPLFFDTSRDIETHPLMALVLSVLDILNANFKAEHIFRFLKTGLTQFETVEVSTLENYVFMWDIKGIAAFSKPWQNNPEGFMDGLSEEAAAQLEVINDLRTRLITPLLSFKHCMDEAADSEQMVTALYNFLCETGVEKAVLSSFEALQSSGEVELADEYRQIWEKLMGIFDQTVATLKGVVLTISEFTELLRLVIANTELAHIPPSLDEVTAGDAERIRSGNVKYAFVIGLAEGIFPRNQSSGGVISDVEREKLITLGLELSPPAEERLLEERFIAYKALTCASKGLYLSYPRGNTAGKVMRPSYFLTSVKQLFPYCDLQYDILSDDMQAVQNERSAYELLAAKFSDNDSLSYTLKDYFSMKSQYREKLISLSAAAQKTPARIADKSTAKALYGERMNISPSRLETFEQCKFLYFCRYGLKARPRRKAELLAPEIGTLIHFVLERLLSSLNGRKLWEIEEQELDKMVSALLDEFANGYLGGLADKSERFKYLFFRLKENVISLVTHIAKELAGSDFYPVDFELEIRSDGEVKPMIIDLPDGGVIAVEGKVDRVDIMKRGANTYLRVIDYKTGSKTFKLHDVIYGLNMQMLIYLFSLCGNAKERYSAEALLPAGVLYLPAKKPDIMAERDVDEAAITKKTNVSYKMNGLVAGVPEVIEGMEHGTKGIFIPAKLTNANEPDFNTSIASFEQFGVLKRHIKKILYDMAGTLRQGDVAAIPVEGLGYHPCDYCDYSAVCGHEKGDRVKFLKEFDDAEVWQAVSGGDTSGKKLD